MATNEESCSGNANFAIICSFILRFGEECGVTSSIPSLQRMLEDTKNVDEDLKEIHIKLLRKSRKWFTKEKWEKALVKFCHEYSNIDAWEIERFGYKKAKLSVKLELLKRLLELQFDSNAKFKSEVNKKDANSLRVLPIGRDVNGCMYWYQTDKDCNMRLYRQDVEDENLWELLCSTKEELENLLRKLDFESSSIQEYNDVKEIVGDVKSEEEDQDEKQVVEIKAHVNTNNLLVKLEVKSEQKNFPNVCDNTEFNCNDVDTKNVPIDNISISTVSFVEKSVPFNSSFSDKKLEVLKDIGENEKNSQVGNKLGFEKSSLTVKSDSDKFLGNDKNEVPVLENNSVIERNSDNFNAKDVSVKSECTIDTVKKHVEVYPECNKSFESFHNKNEDQNFFFNDDKICSKINNDENQTKLSDENSSNKSVSLFPLSIFDISSKPPDAHLFKKSSLAMHTEVQNLPNRKQLLEKIDLSSYTNIALENQSIKNPNENEIGQCNKHSELTKTKSVCEETPIDLSTTGRYREVKKETSTLMEVESLTKASDQCISSKCEKKECFENKFHEKELSKEITETLCTPLSKSYSNKIDSLANKNEICRTNQNPLPVLKSKLTVHESIEQNRQSVICEVKNSKLISNLPENKLSVAIIGNDLCDSLDNAEGKQSAAGLPLEMSSVNLEIDTIKKSSLCEISDCNHSHKSSVTKDIEDIKSEDKLPVLIPNVDDCIQKNECLDKPFDSSGNKIKDAVTIGPAEIKVSDILLEPHVGQLPPSKDSSDNLSTSVTHVINSFTEFGIAVNENKMLIEKNKSEEHGKAKENELDGIKQKCIIPAPEAHDCIHKDILVNPQITENDDLIGHSSQVCSANIKKAEVRCNKKNEDKKTDHKSIGESKESKNSEVISDIFHHALQSQLDTCCVETDVKAEISDSEQNILKVSGGSCEQDEGILKTKKFSPFGTISVDGNNDVVTEERTVAKLNVCLHDDEENNVKHGIDHSLSNFQKNQICERHEKIENDKKVTQKNEKLNDKMDDESEEANVEVVSNAVGINISSIDSSEGTVKIDSKRSSDNHTDRLQSKLKNSINFKSEIKCSEDATVPACDERNNDANKNEMDSEENLEILRFNEQSNVENDLTKCQRSIQRRKSHNSLKEKSNMEHNNPLSVTDNQYASMSKCDLIYSSEDTCEDSSKNHKTNFSKTEVHLVLDSKSNFSSNLCSLNNLCLETKVMCRSSKYIMNNKSYKVKIDNLMGDLDMVINTDTKHESSHRNEECMISEKGKKRGRLKGRRPASSRKAKQIVSSMSSSKDFALSDSVDTLASKKTRARNSSEKNAFTIPEGILEIIGNEERSNLKGGVKRRAKPKEEIVCVSPTIQNSDTDSTPVKRSKRIQAQNIKKMSQLAEEMEKEQRRLEKLAKENAAIAKSKQKEATLVEVKVQPPSNQKCNARLKKKENNDLFEAETKIISRSSRNRSRNLSKMTIMYEDDSKDSSYKALKESDRSKKKRNGRCGKRRKYKPWDISDESSTSSDEEFEIEEEEEEEQEERLVFNTNEDEFACEEIDEDAEPVIVRRARTAKKAKLSGESESENEAAADDKPCSRCERYDEPEWILLCDKCDSGYHTRCLAPPLMIIPDGDWYCPPCEHKFLCDVLLQELHKLDQLLKQKEREELRKQRLAYVGISLDNVLKPEKKEKVEDESFEDDESDESYEDERLCSKRSSRARRAVNYQFKEYDELIRSAIEGEMGFKLVPEENEEAHVDSDTDVVVPHRKKKKTRRLNDLDFTEDEDSGDEYKGSSFSDTEVTPSANSDDSQVDSCSSASWKEHKIKHSRKKSHDRNKKKYGISDDSDDNSDYRPTTRRAAQKNISYRELSSDDEWEGNKSAKAKVHKRKQSESSTENSDQSFSCPKSKKKVRVVHKWNESESEYESEKSMSDSGSEFSDTSAQSSKAWKVKKKDSDQSIKININKKMLDSDSESSSKQVKPKKKNVSRIVDTDDEEEEESDEADKKASDMETSSKSEEDSSSSKPVAENDESKVTSPFSLNENTKCALGAVLSSESTKVEEKNISHSNLLKDCHSKISPSRKAFLPVQNPQDHVKSRNILLFKKGPDFKMYDSSVSETFSNDGIDTADTSALHDLERRRVETLCESDSEIDPRLSKFSGDQFLCKENFGKESEYRPAKESQNFIYNAAEEKSFPIPYPGLTSLQDYPSRPSPLKPSLVETYPNSTSPSKLTPLDSYSEANSPKGFISLDSCSSSKKKKNVVNPETESKSRTLPLTTENFQGEIRFAQEQYPPFERTSQLSPAPCASPPATFVRSPPSREDISPPRMYSQYPEPYTAQRSPDYYHGQQYFSGGDDGTSRPNFPPNFPASDQPAPYQFSGNPGHQSNGGFMIDTLLRSRNQEGTEDELTGVSDIVSYITQG